MNYCLSDGSQILLEYRRYNLSKHEMDTSYMHVHIIGILIVQIYHFLKKTLINIHMLHHTSFDRASGEEKKHIQVSEVKIKMHTDLFSCL